MNAAKERLAASGAVDAAVGVICLEQGLVPPNVGLTELDPELAALIQVIARGRSYADDTVDLKTRALCTVSCLIGLGEQPYIETWVANAITAGATVEEIASLMSQLFVYVGTLKSVTGFNALAAVRDRLEVAATDDTP